jgi:hypothetical protein
MYYQGVAVRLIQYSFESLEEEVELSFPFAVHWMWPVYAYVVMVIFFLVAALLLVVSSAWHLLGEQGLKNRCGPKNN